MALQSADHFFHWLKLATYCVGTPRIEEFASPIRTPVRPESLKGFLKHPSSHRLEVVLHQLAKLHSLLFVVVLPTLEQTPTRMLEDSFKEYPAELALLFCC